MDLATLPRRMNATRYHELPEGPPHFQLVDGELLMSPSPSFFHQTVSMNLSVLIGFYLRQHPIGKIRAAPSDVDLDEQNVYQPDLYFVSNARRHVLTHQGVTGAPDLVIEILSPGTERLDRGRKKTVYIRRGVAELWLVSTFDQSVEVFRLQENADAPALTLRAENPGDILRTPLLPGLEIPLAEVFRA